MIPENFSQQVVPRKASIWTGDVWKLILNIKKSKGLKFKIANFDRGIGIVKVEKDFEFYENYNECNSLNYSDFLNLKSEVDLLNGEEAMEFVLKG
jgi:hypothetical protein